MFSVPPFVAKTAESAYLLPSAVADVSETVPDSVIAPVAATTFLACFAVTVESLIVPDPDTTVADVLPYGKEMLTPLISPPDRVIAVDTDADPTVSVGVCSAAHKAMSEKYFGPTSFFDPSAIC